MRQQLLIRDGYRIYRDGERSRPVLTRAALAGALAVGALALGATAIGVLAIGMVDRLVEVRRLHIRELVFNGGMPAMSHRAPPYD